jgi:riboflavin synthase
MFTGIIQAIGKVSALEQRDGDVRLDIATDELPLDQVNPGDSIAVNGVCLTATEVGAGKISADVSRESLAVTTLGALEVGTDVNLEPALTLTSLVGGHLVSGHVDGIGRVVSAEPDARSVRMVFEIPASLIRYVTPKGSVAIDGTSLTINEVSDKELTINIVPHTLERTIMAGYKTGVRVNVEVDLVARYLESLIRN